MQHSVIFSIFLELLSRDKVSAGELAKKFEVSRRSVLRYIDIICASGVPVVAQQGRYGGFSLMEGYKISAMFFSPPEFARMDAALKSFMVRDSLTEGIIDKLAALNKGGESAPAAAAVFGTQLVVDNPMAEPARARFFELCAAAEKNWLLRLIYRDKKGETSVRDIEPYFMLFAQNIWYCYCFCRLRGDYRFFKVTRVLSLEKCGKFAPRTYDVEKAKSRLVPELAVAEEVCFLLERRVLADVEEWLGVENVRRCGDSGRYEARAELPIDDFLVAKLLFFGRNVELLRPNALKEKMKLALKEALGRYKDIGQT